MKYLVLCCDFYYGEDEITPYCMTNDPKKYWSSKYKIYEVKDNGTFVLIKDFDVTNDKGIALYQWTAKEDPQVDSPEIIGKWNDKNRNNFSLQEISLIKTLAHFEEPAEDILADIESFGAHGEEVDDYWMVFGEYTDDNYSCGY